MGTERKLLNGDGVAKLARDEFGDLFDKFKRHDVPPSDIGSAESDDQYRGPGVYVWWRADKGVIKIGKHQRDSYSRALQHIRDNTRSIKADFEMKDLVPNLVGAPPAHLMLFNLVRDEDIHWVIALEAFLERNADPLIHAGRVG